MVAFQIGVFVRSHLLHTMKVGYRDSAKGSWLQCRNGERRKEGNGSCFRLCLGVCTGVQVKGEEANGGLLCCT